MVNIGIIGFGYWGPNLVRNFSQVDNCFVKTVADLDESRLAIAKKRHPYIKTSKSVSDIFDDPQIDGVVIATPVFLHYDFAKKSLLKGKHVLVEKPMTDSKAKAVELIEIAKKGNRVLMVDHTFLYTGAVKKIKEVISAGLIGELQYFDATRVNLGLFQKDINVIWDLAVHDISILTFLFEEEPYSVIATGLSHTDSANENVAYLTVYFKSKKIAHINCSWVSPVKIRQILIGGTKKMIVYDDIEPTEKVKIYDYGYDVSKETLSVDYRIGDIYTPKIEPTEALFYIANDFIKAISQKSEPISGWKSGLKVVSILEAADHSLKNNGKEVIL
jgi:predicted dehydrogenase